MGRPRLLPPLAFSHPNFALAVLIVTAMHTAVAADGILGGPGRHVAPSWRIFDHLGGVALWGWMHGIVAVLMVVGLYVDFRIVRLGCILSIASYTSTGVAFLCSVLREPHASWLGPSYAFGWAVFSFACLQEPESNPANTRTRRER
jgi:hypothetical protein